MIGIRQLLLIALLIAGFWLLRRLRRRLIGVRRKSTSRRVAYQDMVRCAYCDVHVPRDGTFGDGQRGYFCCADHYRLAQQEGRDD